MKNILTTAVVIAGLLVPVLSSGTTFPYNTPIATATATFALPTTPSSATYNATIRYSWTDLSQTHGSSVLYYDTTSQLLDWALTAGSTNVEHGSFSDAIANSDTGTISLSNLTYGTSYTLTLTGTWGSITVTTGWQPHDPIVSLDHTLFKATPITPVPEPESYAMLLAGLGLIGTIAIRRRNQNNA